MPPWPPARPGRWPGRCSVAMPARATCSSRQHARVARGEARHSGGKWAIGAVCRNIDDAARRRQCVDHTEGCLMAQRTAQGCPMTIVQDVRATIETHDKRPVLAVLCPVCTGSLASHVRDRVALAIVRRLSGEEGEQAGDGGQRGLRGEAVGGRRPHGRHRTLGEARNGCWARNPIGVVSELT